jgi:phosphoglucomutase
MPVNAVMINTIVSSDLGRAVANHYGVKVMQTLTGFKYIGAKMTEFEKSGEYTFVLGYEESYGYLVGDYARDKDAVVASLLVAEAAAYYQRQGLTLTDLLQQIYARHGYYLENLQARTLKGKDGVAKMSTLMDNWRSNAPQHIAGQPVAQVFDYLQDIHSLPVENVLKFLLQDGSWFCLRPSGTEPKMKMYFAVVGKSEVDAKLKLDQLVSDVMQLVDQAI